MYSLVQAKAALPFLSFTPLKSALLSLPLHLLFFLSFPQGIRFTFARKREPARVTTIFGEPHHFCILCREGGIAAARNATNQIRAQHEAVRASAQSSFASIPNAPKAHLIPAQAVTVTSNAPAFDARASLGQHPNTPTGLKARLISPLIRPSEPQPGDDASAEVDQFLIHTRWVSIWIKHLRQEQQDEKRMDSWEICQKENLFPCGN